MSIYTNGYAIGGITAAAAVEVIIQQAATESENIAFINFDAGQAYELWMGRDLEIKEYGDGVYLETEYKLSDTLLMAISLHIKGVLTLFYAENMDSYGCSYYLHGKKMLERLTAAGNNITDEEDGHEFAGHATPQVITHLFKQLTGAALQEAVSVKGKMYLITKQ
jgi:hypothetical protein